MPGGDPLPPPVLAMSFGPQERRDSQPARSLGVMPDTSGQTGKVKAQVKGRVYSVETRAMTGYATTMHLVISVPRNFALRNPHLSVPLKHQLIFTLFYWDFQTDPTL